MKFLWVVCIICGVIGFVQGIIRHGAAAGSE